MTLYRAEYKNGGLRSSELVDFAYALLQLRKLFKVWRIIRVSDGVVVAQSKEWKK